MRFTTAWATITSQNVALRFTLITLASLLTLMSLIAAKLATKNPLLIERSCYTSLLEPKSIAHTPIETEAFVNDVLRQRFNSDANPSSDFMSLDELRIRAKEQDDLAKRQMKQRVVINSVTRKDDQINVDADRIISIGNIRSAFSFPLQLKISETSRTQTNPYGLVARQILPISQGSPDDKK